MDEFDMSIKRQLTETTDSRKSLSVPRKEFRKINLHFRGFVNQLLQRSKC